MTTETSPTASSTLRSKRKLWLAVVLGGVVITGIAYGAWWGLSLRYHESTDDAYVSGNVVQITPQIAGTVVAIDADDTQFVNAGQPLVELDRADAKVALDRAEAQLAKTVREVRTLFATSAQLQAGVEVRQSDVARANEDLARRGRLARSGAILRAQPPHAAHCAN